MAIGGADMPVVVSMLNSYSGWAAAAAGFMLSNDLLIITGALVGSCGAILSYIMCQAMNRSFFSVMLGGFGAAKARRRPRVRRRRGRSARASRGSETAQLLLDARSIIIVPGYGMAVAQAQHPVSELTQMLRERGAKVRFAIHPVAGRLPGHMNVLLAEAKVPYDIVFEMEEINRRLPRHRRRDRDRRQRHRQSGRAGRPVEPDRRHARARSLEGADLIVMKRGMASGYAGVDNPLFYKENTLMLFGDARKMVDEVLSQLRAVAVQKSA